MGEFENDRAKSRSRSESPSGESRENHGEGNPFDAFYLEEEK